MARLISTIGTLMVVVSVLGLAFLFFGPSPEDLIQGPAHPVAPGPVSVQQRPAQASSSFLSIPSISQSTQNPSAAPTPTLEPYAPPAQVATPIERVKIAAIGLDSEVVEAPFVERGGATTWDIPKFKAGHAQGTAGAGDNGNAVLLGHVNSLHSGDVFKDLEQVKVGDEVTLVNGGQSYVYEVTEIKTVPRTDTTMLQSTQKSSVSLFTCTGSWLPTYWDYSDRLVVRGELRRIL
jgi:sortase A